MAETKRAVESLQTFKENMQLYCRGLKKDLITKDEAAKTPEIPTSPSPLPSSPQSEAVTDDLPIDIQEDLEPGPPKSVVIDLTEEDPDEGPKVTSEQGRLRFSGCF